MNQLLFSIKPAAQFPTTRLTRLVNRIYADYFFPISLSIEQFQRMCIEEDVDLEVSAIALTKGTTPIGLALLSKRDTRGWISGVGVLPPWRRQGIGRAMLKYLQQQTCANGLTTLTLEVLTQNHKAAPLYESLGFIWQVDLFLLVSEPGNVEPRALPSTVHWSDPQKVLDYYTVFHDIRAPWQRDLATLRHRAPYLKSLSIWDEGVLVGYLLYQIQPHRQVVYDLAVMPQHPRRLQLARTLLKASHALTPDKGGYITNVPTTEPLLPAFMDLHYHTWQRQYEMLWHRPRQR